MKRPHTSRARRILLSTLTAACLGMLALPAAADPPEDSGCPAHMRVVAWPNDEPPDRNGDGIVCLVTEGTVLNPSQPLHVDNNVGGR
jgi:hypothetical protein